MTAKTEAQERRKTKQHQLNDKISVGLSVPLCRWTQDPSDLPAALGVDKQQLMEMIREYAPELKRGGKALGIGSIVTGILSVNGMKTGQAIAIGSGIGLLAACWGAAKEGPLGDNEPRPDGPEDADDWQKLYNQLEAHPNPYATE